MISLATTHARLKYTALSGAGLMWLGYAALVAALLTYYVTVLAWGVGAGVDFACFRAAALLFARGGNPYDAVQLWRMQNALYNLPGHLHPGAPAYYYLDRYYNPPFFHVALLPLARLPFQRGYAIYTVAVLLLAAVGSWLMLQGLGWTRHRLPAIAVVMVSPSVFLAVRNGQQSTLVLCALGAALYLLRRERPALAGAVLALSWVKPQLLVPFALVAPLLFPSLRATVRWYAGFFLTTALGLALTVFTAGAGSIVAWLHLLVRYSGSVDALHTYLPSLSGMSLVLLPHPWNKLAAALLMALGLGMMALAVAYGRRSTGISWAGLGVLVAAWLLFTPYAHANDDVLLALPLAVAYGCREGRGARLVPLPALWAFSALPLAFLLPQPWKLLGLLPATLALIAALRAQLAALRSEAASPRSA